MSGDELSMQLEGNGRRVFDILKTPKGGIQIRNHFTCVLIEMGCQVHRLSLVSRFTLEESSIFGQISTFQPKKINLPRREGLRLAEHLDLLIQSLAYEIFNAIEKVRDTLHPQRIVDVGAPPLILQDSGFL